MRNFFRRTTSRSREIVGRAARAPRYISSAVHGTRERVKKGVSIHLVSKQMGRSKREAQDRAPFFTKGVRHLREMLGGEGRENRGCWQGIFTNSGHKKNKGANVSYLRKCSGRRVITGIEMKARPQERGKF